MTIHIFQALLRRCDPCLLLAVQAALVIGQPGTTVDAQAVLAELKSKLANFKIPKRCFVVAQLPRNTMGKVQKNLLREQYKNLFLA